MFVTYTSLKQHFSRKHKKLETRKKMISNPKCKFCQKMIKGSRIEHYNSAHLDKINIIWQLCDLCGLYCAPKVMKYHKNKHQATMIQCTFCPRPFAFMNEYIEHATRIHTTQVTSDWLMCSICKLYLPTQKDVDSHINTRHKQSQNACFFCSKLFISKRNLLSHVQLNHSVEASKLWHKCDLCKLFLRDKFELENHNCKPNNIQEVQCEFCSSIFSDGIVYISHANKVHSSEISEKWFPCKYCHLALPSSAKLDNHLCVDLFRSQISCECSETISTMPNLTTHANKHHKKEITEHWLACTYCPLFYPRKKMLQIHKKKIHFDLWKIHKHKRNNQKQCQFCFKLVGQSIASKSYHLNTKHKDKIPIGWVTCHKCKWFYSSEEILINHQAFCSNEKTKVENRGNYLQCQNCPEMFYRKGLLPLYYKHANQEHFENVSSAWQSCKSCKKYYPDQESLQKHTR